MRFKQSLVILTLFFSIHSRCFSATKGTSSHSFGPSTEVTPTLVMAGIGLMDYMGHFGFSFFGDFLIHITNDQPLYIGAETGIDVHESHRYDWYTSSSSSYTGMPLTATGMYRFQLSRIPDLHPYAALSFGPYFSLSSGRSVVLQMNVRPGISWKIADNMTVNGEARFGVIGGGFFICPSAALTFIL
jgi:hypothetical protein